MPEITPDAAPQPQPQRGIDWNPLNHWGRFSEANPLVTGLASMIPVVGAVPSGLDSINSFRRGNWGTGLAQGAMAATSVLPGGGPLGAAGRLVGRMAGAPIKAVSGWAGKALGHAPKPPVWGAATAKVPAKLPGQDKWLAYQDGQPDFLAASPLAKSPAVVPPAPGLMQAAGKWVADKGRALGKGVEQTVGALTPPAAIMGAQFGGAYGDMYRRGDAYFDPAPWHRPEPAAPAPHEPRGPDAWPQMTPQGDTAGVQEMKQAAAYRHVPPPMGGSEKRAAALALARQDRLFEKWAAEQIVRHHPDWPSLDGHRKEAVLKQMGDVFTKHVMPRLSEIGAVSKSLAGQAGQAAAALPGQVAALPGRAGAAVEKGVGDFGRRLQQAGGQLGGDARSVLGSKVQEGGRPMLGGAMDTVGRFLDRHAGGIGTGVRYGLPAAAAAVPATAIGYAVGRGSGGQKREDRGEEKASAYKRADGSFAGNLAMAPVRATGDIVGGGLDAAKATGKGMWDTLRSGGRALSGIGTGIGKAFSGDVGGGLGHAGREYWGAMKDNLKATLDTAKGVAGGAGRSLGGVAQNVLPGGWGARAIRDTALAPKAASARRLSVMAAAMALR